MIYFFHYFGVSGRGSTTAPVPDSCGDEMPYKDKTKRLAMVSRIRRANLPKYAAKQKQYYIDNPGIYLRNVCKARAKKLGVPFNLTANDFEIPEFCLVLGIKLERGEKGFHDNAPSVDRLLPELGYVKGNIAIISFRANRLKGNASVEELFKLANWVKTQVGEREVAESQLSLTEVLA